MVTMGEEDESSEVEKKIYNMSLSEEEMMALQAMRAKKPVET